MFRRVFSSPGRASAAAALLARPVGSAARLLTSRPVASATAVVGASSLYLACTSTVLTQCEPTTKSAPVCVVVGVGEKGIGEHVAQKFSNEGYSVAVLARRKENLDAIEKQIANTKGFKCDVSNVDEINSTVEAILTHYGAIDVLIVNTSGGAFTSFDKTSQADFEMAMKSGPTALFALAKAVAPGMLARGSGVIGVTGATAAWRGMPHTYSKASSNFAMRALCQSLARDMAPRGIHVFHVVVDGLVSQPRTHGWLPKKPKEEFLQPAAIAETYYALATQPPSCWTSELNIVAGPVFGSSASI